MGVAQEEASWEEPGSEVGSEGHHEPCPSNPSSGLSYSVSHQRNASLLSLLNHFFLLVFSFLKQYILILDDFINTQKKRQQLSRDHTALWWLNHDFDRGLAAAQGSVPNPTSYFWPLTDLLGILP